MSAGDSAGDDFVWEQLRGGRLERQEISDLVNSTVFVVLRELDGFELRDPGSFER